MIVDANLLVYAADRNSPHHTPAREWLAARLNGTRPVGLPWQSLCAFLQVVTNPRITRQALAPERAWTRVSAWLDCSVAWTPEPGRRYREIFGELLLHHRVTADLVPDAQLAALALEHGLTVCSADTDFARFTEVRWENPLAA